MYSFEACYQGSTVYLNKKHQYSTNEILVQLLNHPFENLKELRSELNRTYTTLTLEGEMPYHKVLHYNDSVIAGQSLLHRIDSLLGELPFFQAILSSSQLQKDVLIDCLNTIGWVWQGHDEDDYGEEDDEYGLYLYEESRATSGHYYYRTTFVPDYGFIPDDVGMLQSIDRFNDTLKQLFDRYTLFLDDLLRVQLVYTDFVDNYLGSKGRYLTDSELADAYLRFIKRYGQAVATTPYRAFAAGNAKMSHEVLETTKGKVLCESYQFDGLGAFLYHDLFRGIAQRHIPKRCGNCGRYFLIPAGRYSDYCQQPAPEDNSKTCREVGSRKRYDSKCKNDPVWTIYNLAYKAHYARYLKKKMTTAEFERWSAWAVEYRTLAEQKKLPLEVYEKKMRE